MSHDNYENYWVEIYKKNFKDNLDPNLSLTKSEQIFKSRAQNQNLLIFNGSTNNNNNFGYSPYDEHLEFQKYKLNFTIANHTLNKKLREFSNKHKSFRQFVNKGSKNYPKVFKSVVVYNNDNNDNNTCTQENINNNNNIYNYYLDNDDNNNDNINKTWTRVIKIDFYSSKDHFEFWFVFNEEEEEEYDEGFFEESLDLYVNKKCIIKNIYNIHDVNKINNNSKLNYICKQMNVKCEDLIKFIISFVF